MRYLDEPASESPLRPSSTDLSTISSPFMFTVTTIEYIELNNYIGVDKIFLSISYLVYLPTSLKAIISVIFITISFD